MELLSVGHEPFPENASQLGLKGLGILLESVKMYVFGVDFMIILV